MKAETRVTGSLAFLPNGVVFDFGFFLICSRGRRGRGAFYILRVIYI